MHTVDSHMVVEVQMDEQEVARARRRREQFARNSHWLQQHAIDIYGRYRGKCICVAGCELFEGETVEEAVAQAIAAHPDEEGWFTRYIPTERIARIYAV